METETQSVWEFVKTTAVISVMSFVSITLLITCLFAFSFSTDGLMALKAGLLFGILSSIFIVTVYVLFCLIMTVVMYYEGEMPEEKSSNT